MEDAKKVIQEVKDNLTKCAGSRKDEITVMKALMNDPNYNVDVYGKPEIEQYYPGKDFRKVVSNVISSVTKVPHREATELVNQYEFNRSDANAIVELSKEFVLSYLQTGRKLPLGGRKTSDIELVWKEISERTTNVPIRGSDTERASVYIPAHGGIKAINPCPVWVPASEKESK